MRSRFLQPETTTLKLSGGDTLTVKRRLNIGEHREMMAKMSTFEDGQLRANPFEVGPATVLAYLVDWSLTDADGTQVEIRGKSRAEVRAILDDLERPDFDEIQLAINTHVEAQDRALAAEKNGPDGRLESPATSPSPDAATGVMSGSRS